jgi:uncharacterized repeat protein (TIGR04138 family)
MPLPAREKSLQDVVDDLGLYPVEAFIFVQQGLTFAADRVHGELPRDAEPKDYGECRHISGQQLCDGLREYALSRWGLMARAVLARWSITATYDFGRIVFALIESGFMQKTDEDTIEDFRNVFDFRTAFDAGYRITPKLASESRS